MGPERPRILGPNRLFLRAEKVRLENRLFLRAEKVWLEKGRIDLNLGPKRPAGPN